MSKIKRMRMVPFEADKNSNKSEIIKDAILLETPPNTLKTSEIENELENLLNSNIDERLKFDHFIQLFRKFLIYKEKIKTIPISGDEKALAAANDVSNFMPFDHSSPNQSSFDATLLPTSPLVITPKITPKRRYSRLKKKSAIKKIKKLMNEEQNSTEDEDKDTTWIPYKAAKTIKTISRIKKK